MKIDLTKYDEQHAAYIESLTDKLTIIYQSIIRLAVKYGLSVNFDAESGEIFDFDKFPRLKKKIEELFNDMYSQINTTIQNAISEEWQFSADKYDFWLSEMLSKGDMTKDEIEAYIKRNNEAIQSRRNEALAAFRKRVENGMNLSDRVWKLTEQFKSELELALDVGISDGKSADAISRDIRQYLNNPDKLFRRVRDKHGNLKLSKAAEAYHPGQGVYRSSYKNAMRVARTEVNMAYRSADHENWSAEKMVIGIKVSLSNNHTLNGKPFFDICDELQGIYPKDFKFTGFHIACRCWATPITPTQAEVIDYTKKLMAGEDVSGYKFKNEVTELPRAFRFWYAKNYSRVARMKHKPNFITDNQGLIDGKPTPTIEPSVKEIKIPSIYDKIRETEQRIRLNKDFETGVVFDKEGNILVDKRGSSRHVAFTKDECAKIKDAILTHNHPGGWKFAEGKLGRVGNSFSADDIVMAIAYDLEEIRAVTPLYTFSLKRPKEGWGINWKEARKAYGSAKNSVDKSMYNYFEKVGREIENYTRANAICYHLVMKRLAKKYGWEYTKIKG